MQEHNFAGINISLKMKKYSPCNNSNILNIYIKIYIKVIWTIKKYNFIYSVMFMVQILKINYIDNNIYNLLEIYFLWTYILIYNK